MGQPILVVYVYGGCYQDENQFEKALIATFEPDVAQRYIRRRKALDVLHDRRREAVRLFDDKYRTDNPRPEFTNTHLLRAKVKWPAGMRQQDITPEMRQERLDIQAHNDSVWAAHSVLTEEWDVKFDAARRLFLKVAKVPEKKHDYFLGYGHTERAKEWHYKIKELKVI